MLMPVLPRLCTGQIVLSRFLLRPMPVRIRRLSSRRGRSPSGLGATLAAWWCRHRGRPTNCPHPGHVRAAGQDAEVVEGGTGDDLDRIARNGSGFQESDGHVAAAFGRDAGDKQVIHLIRLCDLCKQVRHFGVTSCRLRGGGQSEVSDGSHLVIDYFMLLEACRCGILQPEAPSLLGIDKFLKPT